MYRTPPPTEIRCPRCRKTLPPEDVARDACGAWISGFAADAVLTAAELAPDTMTRWWRVRAPCPICGEKMLLRGTEPGLFQGCDGHGFWIDADTIEHTSLAAGTPHAAIQQKRDDDARVERSRDAAERAELERAAAREAKLAAEHRIANLPLEPPKPITLAGNYEEPMRIESLVEAATKQLTERIATMGDLSNLEARLMKRIEHLEARVAELEVKS